MTWTTFPSFSGSIVDSVSVPLLIGCVDLDVTSDVQQWVSGSGQTNDGWTVKDSNEAAGAVAGVDYASREFGTAGQRPKLTIVYTP